MGDPIQASTAVEIDRAEAMSLLQALLEEVPDADQTFAEKYANQFLLGSPASLLQDASVDRQIRDAHGTTITTSALVRAVAQLASRVEELERDLAEAAT